MRAFIAIELSGNSKVWLAKRVKDLQSDLVGISIRWLPINNIHLTLNFFRHLHDDDLENVGMAMKHAMAIITPFELNIGGLGAYPNPQKARVIWVPIGAQNMLDRIKEKLEEGLARLGYPREKRPFSPHLTLGRVRRGVAKKDLALIKDTIQHQRPGLGSTIKVDEIVLFRSELNSAGAKYSKLLSAIAAKNDEELEKH